MVEKRVKNSGKAPPFRAMPERNRFFLYEVFPYLSYQKPMFFWKFSKEEKGGVNLALSRAFWKIPKNHPLTIPLGLHGLSELFDH